MVNYEHEHLFYGIVSKIADVDQAAAEYILDLEKEFAECDDKLSFNFNYDDDLMGLFVFCETPQGFNYWFNIHRQLGKLKGHNYGHTRCNCF